MFLNDLDILVVILFVILFTILQSVLGVGLLVFGTPTFLLLGYTFSDTLSYLLPSSIAISFFQVYYNWNLVNLYKYNVFYYLLPFVVIGLLFVFFISSINLNFLVGLILFLTFLIRYFKEFNNILESVFLNNFKISLSFIGLVHGLTNLGGGPLVAVTNGIYSEKEEIRVNIAYAYLTMAIVQIITLILIGEFIFEFLVIALPFISTFVYIFFGEYIFNNTNKGSYNSLMSFLILFYSLLLLFKNFFKLEKSVIVHKPIGYK